MDNKMLLIPLVAGMGGGAAIGAAKSEKGDRIPNAMQGAALGSLLGGSVGAVGSMAHGMVKADTPITQLKEQLSELKREMKERPRSEKPLRRERETPQSARPGLKVNYVKKPQPHKHGEGLLERYSVSKPTLRRIRALTQKVSPVTEAEKLMRLARI
jgi:hypothetical protein